MHGTTTQNPATLDKSVEGVVLQFSFSNKNAVSAWLWSNEAETLQGRRERKSKEATSGGVQFITPQERVSLEDIFEELEAGGYVLNDVLTQERAHPTQKGQSYWTARFILTRGPLVRPLEESRAEILRRHYRPALKQLVTEAMWRVRAYRNPLQREVLTFGISINCEVRTPYRNSVGEHNTMWKKDASGDRIGDKPEPIAPAAFLNVIDGCIVVK